MATRNQAGFTLIELMIVLAISTALLGIVLAGQSELRSRSQFDGSVDKVVSSVVEARDQATAGVNLSTSSQAGTGVNACTNPGSPPGEYVFEGVVWSADNSRSGSPFQFSYYEAGPLSSDHNTLAANAVACTFGTPESIGLLEPDVQVDAGNPVGQQGGQVLFVRTSSGGLDVCFEPLGVDPATIFAAGSCATGMPPTLNLSDLSGHTSSVTINASGLAERNN